MHRLAIVFGLILIGLAVAGDLGDSSRSASEAATAPADGSAPVQAKWFRTAWIPACVGLPLVICGLLVVFRPTTRKHAMHVAVGVAALGALLAGGRAIMSAGKVLSADPTVNVRALWFVVLMALVCAVYVVLSVRSFVQARRQMTGTPKT